MRRDEVANFLADFCVTDADDRFRFEKRRLRWAPGTHWIMTLSRLGCADVHRTITLRAGPIDGRAQNEARNVELRLPHCDARTHTPAAHGSGHVVRLHEDVCIAYLGPECGACIGLCPHGLDALSLDGTRPVLDAERCVGCGLCIDACPTTPNAFELLPLTRDDEESVGRAGPV